MRAIWTALVGVYVRWKFVEETESAPEAARTRGRTQTGADELHRLRDAISREQGNLRSFERYECRALAGPCEASIRALESRIRALELQQAR